MDYRDIAITLLSYIGVSVPITLVILRFFGKRWIESIFEKQLQKLRHDHAKEIETYKNEIAILFNRISKIHQKEFEIIPIAWEKFIDAISHAELVLRQLRMYPDFNKMTSEELEEALSGLDFPETAKEKIRLADKNKNNVYYEISIRRDTHLAKKHCAEFHDYINRNKIFLSEPLKAEFVKASDMIWSCILEREIGTEDRDHRMMSEASKKFFKEITNIMNNIEILVQRRLKYEKAD
ncbi:hypothetical protein [Nitratidesulfovibrio termitidis]|uniref:hypothetical protein n=1 Tax=Nitratidesulfovibrio termitidis TaxID=42252 RepID=UPI0012EC8BB2|nr:hypothetical protein [Nitratidesulfovibrio termitidis]